MPGNVPVAELSHADVNSRRVIPTDRNPWCKDLFELDCFIILDIYFMMSIYFDVKSLSFAEYILLHFKYQAAFPN